MILCYFCFPLINPAKPEEKRSSWPDTPSIHSYVSLPYDGDEGGYDRSEGVILSIVKKRDEKKTQKHEYNSATQHLESLGVNELAWEYCWAKRHLVDVRCSYSSRVRWDRWDMSTLFDLCQKLFLLPSRDRHFQLRYLSSNFRRKKIHMDAWKAQISFIHSLTAIYFSRCSTPVSAVRLQVIKTDILAAVFKL